MAGNWLYDQFCRQHHDSGHYADNTAYTPGGIDAGR